MKTNKQRMKGANWKIRCTFLFINGFYDEIKSKKTPRKDFFAVFSG